MHKKILLTSARAICIAVPAVAEPTVSATFPDVYVDGNKIDVKKHVYCLHLCAPVIVTL